MANYDYFLDSNASDLGSQAPYYCEHYYDEDQDAIDYLVHNLNNNDKDDDDIVSYQK